MNASSTALSLLLRLAAPFAWAGEARIARKLRGFAVTEAGSALDMLAAAERTGDPRIRRLFFRHAMDETRHARLFREAAARIGDRGAPAPERSQAARCELLEQHGLVRFLAFVWLSEARAAAQFTVLQRHFEDRPELAALFARIGKDERFHVAYSRRLLDEQLQAGRGAEVRNALLAVRASRAWEAWRRQGRLLGSAASRLLLSLLYLVALPPFALLQRTLDPERTGWKAPRPPATTLPAARSQG